MIKTKAVAYYRTYYSKNRKSDDYAKMLNDQKYSVKAWAKFNNVDVKWEFTDERIKRREDEERPQLNEAFKVCRNQSIEMLVYVDLGHRLKDDEIETDISIWRARLKRQGLQLDVQVVKKEAAKIRGGYKEEARESSHDSHRKNVAERSKEPAEMIDLLQWHKSEKVKANVLELNERQISIFSDGSYYFDPGSEVDARSYILKQLDDIERETGESVSVLRDVFQDTELTNKDVIKIMNELSDMPTPSGESGNWTDNKIALSKKRGLPPKHIVQENVATSMHQKLIEGMAVELIEQEAEFRAMMWVKRSGPHKLDSLAASLRWDALC